MSEEGRSVAPSPPAVIIKLSFLGPLRFRLRTRTEELTLPAPVTVRHVVDRLIEVHGGEIRDLFYNQYGWLDPRVFFVVDGDSVVSRKGLDTPLTGNEEITIFLALPMSGG